VLHRQLRRAEARRQAEAQFPVSTRLSHPCRRSHPGFQSRNGPPVVRRGRLQAIAIPDRLRRDYSG
jgi:hypothetical protein